MSLLVVAIVLICSTVAHSEVLQFEGKEAQVVPEQIHLAYGCMSHVHLQTVPHLMFYSLLDHSNLNHPFSIKPKMTTN